MAGTTVDTLNDVVDPNDGVTSLREAIDRSGSSDYVEFSETLRGGTINLKSTLVVDTDLTLSAEDRNLTIRGGNFDLIDIVGAKLDLSWIKLEGGSDGIELKGNNSELYAQYIEIENSGDDGIDIQNAPGAKVFMQSASITNAGDEGVEIRNSNGAELSFADVVTIEQAGSDGIDVRSNNVRLYLSDTWITNSGSDGVELKNSNDATISSSGRFLGNQDDGIDIQASKGVDIFLSGDIKDSGDEGIEVKDSDNLTLTLGGATIEDSAGDGLDFKGRGNVSLNINNSTIQNNQHNGINIAVDSADLVINGGAILNNGAASITLKSTSKTSVTINGTSAADILIGSDVGDQLNGGFGDDTLTGGTGGDVFGFSQNSGQDTITDFELGKDRLNVQALGITDLNSIVLSGNTVLFDVVNGGQVSLLNVEATLLSATDFIFS